jgi:IS66 C-terminal element
MALTRKNALFAGHDAGAQNWAIVASLIETSKLIGIDPYRYLADVLFHLVNLWPKRPSRRAPPWYARPDLRCSCQATDPRGREHRLPPGAVDGQISELLLQADICNAGDPIDAGQGRSLMLARSAY